MDNPKEVGSAMRKETQTLLAADFKEKSVDDLGKLLQHSDMRVRQKAQFELAMRGSSGKKTLLAAVSQTDHQLARVHGIWGIAQLARKNAKHGADLVSLLQDSDTEIRAQAAKWLGDIRYKDAGDALMPLLKDDAPRVRFFAAEALGRIAHKAAIQPIIEMLIDNKDADAYLRHAGALALARIGEADPVVALAKHESKALRIAAVVALRRMKHPGIADFLQDENEFIVTEAARAINDDLSIEGALPALARVLQDKRFTEEALLRRAINANLRVGKEENLNILTGFISRTDAPEAMRAEAIAALGTWAKPSVFDRVDGRYRGPIERDAATAQAAIQPIIQTLFTDANSSIQAASAGAAGRLKIKEAGADLFKMLQNSRTKEVRVASLEALSNMQYEKLEDAVEIALKDTEQDVRAEALSILPTLDLPAEQVVDFFSLVLEAATITEQQTALKQLGALPSTQTAQLFEQLLDQYIANKMKPGIQLEFLEALEASKAEDLQTKLEAHQKAQSEKDPLYEFRVALAGGNARRGWRIFNSHETAQCIRCHTLTPGEEGVVGPNLRGVGNRLSREEILESLIEPSAQIAAGYGIVSLTLTDDSKVSGTVKKETNTQLTLQIGEEETREIAKSEVSERVDAPSSMIPMGTLLEKEELRDLVEFLSFLKDD